MAIFDWERTYSEIAISWLLIRSIWAITRKRNDTTFLYRLQARELERVRTAMDVSKLLQDTLNESDALLKAKTALQSAKQELIAKKEKDAADNLDRAKKRFLQELFKFTEDENLVKTLLPCVKFKNSKHAVIEVAGHYPIHARFDYAKMRFTVSRLVTTTTPSGWFRKATIEKNFEESETYTSDLLETLLKAEL
jgi:hypothetical protein